MSGLCQQQCQPLAKGTPPMEDARLAALLPEIPNWQLNPQRRAIHREYSFKDFYATMAFVNALAWVAHSQDHHPELQISYKRCVVSYSTHSIGGLSLNDFICAARIDALLNSPT